MEGAMPNTRFSPAGAAALLVLGLAAGSAAAQTATGDTPGKPLQLLKIVEQPSRPKIRPHAKTGALKSSKTHVARLEHKRPHAQTAATPAPASAWPAANSSAATNVAAAEPAPAAQFASAPSAFAPSDLVVGGQTVQIASPDAVNQIDLAASDADPHASTGAPGSAAAGTLALNDAPEPTTKSDAINSVSTPPPGSPVGSTSWLLQVFAALGGAVAAGSVAWFLIGSAPQRTYG
jgi:hypothetical protein